MPQIPTAENLGRARVNGQAKPAEINPMVAYDIGRAGAAMNHAMDQVAAAFGQLGEKQQAMDDQTWLSDAKIRTLEADDAIKRDTELNAGPDGTGYEQAPARLKGTVDDITKKPGGSPEARQKYNLWAAEQTYETGRWAANSAQKRLQGTTLENLDKRLDTLTGLAASNPERSEEYLSAYEEEVNGYVGSAISASDAKMRIDAARSTISKSSIITRAIKNPSDFGKALKAVEDTGRPDIVNTETRGLGPQPKAVGSYDTTEAITGVSTKLETGKTDPLQGVKNISRDARGSKSYGNFGLNSMGSAQEFQAQYGKEFGLTAKPGTREFDEQWKSAAKDMGAELHTAELEWWNNTIGSKVVNNLVRAGVASDVANDPRVKAYFADRSVQYGPASIANHADRVKAAFDASSGDPVKFLTEMSKADGARISGDFRSALAGDTASPRGLANRVKGRLEQSLAVTGAGPSTEITPSLDLSKLPKVDGTIQPAELYKLSTEDRAAVIKQLAPHLQIEMQDKMTKAIDAIGAKGSQDVITPQQIDDAAPLIGVKNADKWKQQLSDAKLFYDTSTEAKSMTREERYARLRDMVPTGNPADLADTERKRYDIWRSVIDNTEKQIKADPLKYLGQENESGRQAMKMIAGADPGAAGTPTRERALDTMIELQKREGVAPSDIRILNAGQAEDIVKKLQDAKTGPAALVQLEGLRQTYGKHFDRIWGELVDHGAPNTFLALRTATRDGQDALVQSYALERAMGEGKDTKKDLLRERAGVKMGDLQKAVSTKVADFLTALDRKEGSGRIMESYRSAVERTALYYTLQGQDMNSAVNKASDEIYGKNLVTYKGIIIPRAIDDRNGSDLKYAIDHRVGDLVAPVQNQIISNIRDAGGIYPAGYERQRFLDSLKSNPRWVTNEDATGAYMLDERGMYVLYNAGRSVQPLQFTWEQFTDALKRHPISGQDRFPGAN
jgi:hypothetical protein